MENNKKKFYLNNAFGYFYLIGLIAFILIPPKQYNTRQKACFSNIRILQGAVEMYNMDSKEMMSLLDEEILIKGNYLKGPTSHPTVECQYVGKNLDVDGMVYCTYHGDVEGKTVGKCGQRNKVKEYMEGCLSRIPESLVWPYSLLKRITTKH